MDQKLLLAVISTVRLDAEVLVEKWRELFLGMCPPPISFPIVSVSLFSSLIHSSHWGKNKYRLTGTATDQDKCPTKRAIVEHVAKLKRSMGIGGVKGKVKVKGDEVQEEEEEEDGLGNSGKCGKKLNNKKKMKGTVTSSGTPTRLRGKGRQGNGPVSSRSTRDMTDDELDDEHVLGESRIKNEDAEYASLPFTVMMADDDTPCPTPRNAKVWGSIPWMFDEEEDEAEAETERDDCNGAVPIPRSVKEIPSRILRPSTLPLLASSFLSTKEDDTPRSTERSKTSHQEKSSPGIMTTTATFPKKTSSSSSTPTTHSTTLSPPNPSSSATTTIQEKEELDRQQDPNSHSHSNDLFVSPIWETAQAESTATSTGEASSSAKMKKQMMMKEREKKRSYHFIDVDSAYCSRGNKKRLKRSNDDDDDDVGGGSSGSSKVGGRGTRKKRIPLAVLEDYPVGQ